jgi:hypothetical protein
VAIVPGTAHARLVPTLEGDWYTDPARFSRPFDLRGVFTKPKPVVLACRESSSPYLVVEDPRHVVNCRNVPGGRRCVRGAGSNLPRVHLRRRAALAGRAGVPGVSCDWVRVRVASTCRSFDLRGVCTRPIPVALACRESSVPYLVVEDPRHVGNRRNVPGGRRRARGAGSNLPRGSPAAPVAGSQVALAYPAFPARLGAGAGRKANGGARSQRPSPHGHSCDAGNGSRSRPPDVCRHRGVVEGLHRRDEANDDSRQKKKRDRF